MIFIWWARRNPDAVIYANSPTFIILREAVLEVFGAEHLPAIPREAWEQCWAIREQIAD